MNRVAALVICLAACHAPAQHAPVAPPPVAVVVAPPPPPRHAVVHRSDPGDPAPPPLAEVISTGHDECALRQSTPIDDTPAPTAGRMRLLVRPCKRMPIGR